MRKSESIKGLQSLCNIGPKTAERLYSLGIKTPEQMRKSDPEKLYERLRNKEGGRLDRCVLYQFRGAVSGTLWWECK